VATSAGAGACEDAFSGHAIPRRIAARGFAGRFGLVQSFSPRTKAATAATASARVCAAVRPEDLRGARE